MSSFLIPESGQENKVGTHFSDNENAMLEVSIVYEMGKASWRIGGISQFLLTDRKNRTSVFNKVSVPS